MDGYSGCATSGASRRRASQLSSSSQCGALCTVLRARRHGTPRRSCRAAFARRRPVTGMGTTSHAKSRARMVRESAASMRNRMMRKCLHV